MLKNQNICDSKQLKQVRNIAPKSYLIIHPHFCVFTMWIRRVTHVLQRHFQAVGKLTERTLCTALPPQKPQQQPTKPSTFPATSAITLDNKCPARPPLLAKAFVSSHKGLSNADQTSELSCSRAECPPVPLHSPICTQHENFLSFVGNVQKQGSHTALAFRLQLICSPFSSTNYVHFFLNVNYLSYSSNIVYLLQSFNQPSVKQYESHVYSLLSWKKLTISSIITLKTENKGGNVLLKNFQTMVPFLKYIFY